ncbi:MAG: papain-like cysteine protease family protein [Bryobacteraceae bacterium]
MVIETRVRFEDGGVTITQSFGDGTSGANPDSAPAARPKNNNGSGEWGPAGPGGGGPLSGGLTVVFGSIIMDCGRGHQIPIPSMSGPIANPTGTASAIAQNPQSPAAFRMRPQEMDLWCWAAVAAAVAEYFSPASPPTQCSIATQVKDTNCCPGARVCDEAAFLEDALTAVGHLRDDHAGFPSFERIREELRNGFPVGVRIGWFGGGGHFVVITGCRESGPGEQIVMIADPRYSESTWLYDEFVHAYHSAGECTHTYFLKA